MSLPDPLAGFNGNDPASDASISACEESLGFKFPRDYAQFMRGHDGGEGFVGDDSYLMLWQIEELEPFNREYEVADYCPGLLLIGSSGGGEAYAFDTRTSPWNVVQVPFVGMDFSLVEALGPSFDEFIETLARRESRS